MIKRKGVCDVCAREFELDAGSFGITIAEEGSSTSPRKWTITVSSCVDGCLEEGFSHVCGMACLYEAISKAMDRETKHADLRIVGYNGDRDNNVRVLDMRDAKTKQSS